MNPSSTKQSRRGRWLIWVLLFVIVVLTFSLALISARILHTADQHQVRRADAIVVFGAAEYAGRPSPVFRARLDHAFDLFSRGVAPVVITTGGAGLDPSFSEGGVGRDYLMRRGVPERNLIAETQGTDTAHSAERVAVIMRANGMGNCVAVSDSYHVFRIQKLLEHEGIHAYVAPRPDSRPRSRWQRFVAVLREAFSYLAWWLHLSF
jgi:uncharacterized SAM-binding protein YcdF (DUF218 family)